MIHNHAGLENTALDAQAQHYALLANTKIHWDRMAISRLAISLTVAQHLPNQTAQHQQMAEPAVSKAKIVQQVVAIVAMLPRAIIPQVAEHYSAPVAPAKVAWTGLTVAQSRRVIIPPVVPHQKSPRTVFPVANAENLPAGILQPVVPRKKIQPYHKVALIQIAQQVVNADLQVRVIIPPVAEPNITPTALGTVA